MERLRFTRRGWFRYWFRMETGAVDIRTGIRYPDRDGYMVRVFWVGPYLTAKDAMAAPLRK